MMDEWGEVDLENFDLDQIDKADLDVDWRDISKLVKEIRAEQARKRAAMAFPHPGTIRAGGSGEEVIEITEAYQTALNVVRNGEPLVLVHGRAGTGKSTLVRFIREQVSNVVVLAPTGIAALNAQGQTIHSFCRFPPRLIRTEDVTRASRTVCRNTRLLIIDEISMVRADLLDGVERFFRLNGPNPNAPFGGVPVMLVGDFYQLPPVVATDDEYLYLHDTYGGEHFFFSKIFERLKPFVVELDKVFRQHNPVFVELLNKIRTADDVPYAVSSFNEHCFKQISPADSFVRLTCTNRQADVVNTERMNALPGEGRLYRSSSTGRMGMRHGRLPAPAHLNLKAGAQVMFLRNGADKQWVNGSLGMVEDMSSENIFITLCHGKSAGMTVTLKRETWEQVRYRYDRTSKKIEAKVVGTYTQFPLMPAWAVTIHKAQGQTYDRVEVDLGEGAFAPGQLYVALSRCRTLEGLCLSRPIRETDVICDPVIKLLDRFLASSGK
jgi:ATP-dependent exoDNAse (exonuclease V) alpha subunit